MKRLPLVACLLNGCLLICPGWLVPVAALQETGQPEADIRMIWDEAAHSAFTDLADWNGDLWCAFRIGSGHVPGEQGEDGRIQILRSRDDGSTWQASATLDQPGIDLRDPKLSVMPDGRLMLLAGGSRYDGNTLLGRRTLVAFLDNPESDFSDWQPIRFRSARSGEADWLWRVTWQGDTGYGVIYQAGGETWPVHLTRTRNGIDYDLLATPDLPGKPNESTVRFDGDGRMRIVVRNETGGYGHLGIADTPQAAIHWSRIPHRLGGPNLIRLPDGTWLLATRQYSGDPTTVLGRLADDGSFQPMLTLPSGGDTSYPGLLIRGDRLLVSWYSSHTGQATIWFAAIPLERFQAGPESANDHTDR